MNDIILNTIKFDNELSFSDIYLLRSAFIKHSNKNDELIHNHIKDNFRYSYPLIQYKEINEKAVIICFNDGIIPILKVLKNCELFLKRNENKIPIKLSVINSEIFDINALNGYNEYIIKNWLPFNGENYNKYLELQSLKDKICFLENILIGNILSLGKGLNITFDFRLKCELIDIIKNTTVIYKRTKMISMDIVFKVNLDLPNFIGLGKGVSIGNGVIYKKTKI